ncbi:MAG: DEAD/DEAH box helicase [Desulfobacteraceae bacterium]|nr:DEAD/DEAH box helicase [Desulfobacteraceae bacterium]
MTKKNAALTGHYRKLPPVLKAMVRIMAIETLEMRQRVILACLDELGFKNDNDKHFAQKDLHPLVAYLQELGLLIKFPKGVTCPDAIRTEAVQDAVLADQFRKIAPVLLKYNPLDKGYQRYFFKTTKELYRAVQLTVYGGEVHAALEEIISSGYVYSTTALRKDSPFLTLFNRPFRPEVFDRIPPETRIKTLSHLLQAAETILEPSEAAFEYGLGLLLQNPELPAFDAMSGLLFRGELERHGSLEKELPPSPALSTQMGWSRMIRGDSAAALAHFKEAIAAIKKSTRKRKVFLTGYGGLFFMFALLKSDSAEDHRAALAYIDLAKKQYNPLRRLLAGMKPLFLEKVGLPARTHDNLDDCISDNPLLSLFSILILTWLDKKRKKKHIEILEGIRKKAALSGHRWIEAEANALLAKLAKNKKNNKKQAEKAHEQCGTQSLTALVQPTPAWEKKLNALIMMGDSTSPEPDSAYGNHRLIWLIDHNEEDNTCHITPRLQKRSKSNTWTRGRAVGLKNLYENYHTMEGLTDQDKQVASTIEEESYRSGSYRYSYRQVEYNLDEDKALPALAGHPCIFLEDALESPVELVMGKPEVGFRQEKGKIKVRMSPMPNSSDDSVLVVRETPSRFKAVRFSDEHLHIAEVLGKKGLNLPAHTESMASQAIASISSMVTVNSDLDAGENGDVREIAADSTPHAHIMPSQDGLKVEFHVRPLTDKGSYFKPGHGGVNVFAEIDGEKVRAVRDLSQEEERLHDVIEQCPSLDRLEEVGGQWLVEGPEESLELLLELKTYEEDIVIEWPQGEKLRVRSQVSSFDDFKMSVKKDREWFKATGSLTIDDDLALDLTKLMNLLDQPSGRFVALDDGSFLALTCSLKERLKELKAYTTPHGKGFRLAPLATPAIEELTQKASSLRTDKAWKAHCKRLKEVIEPQVPPTLQASLRDYQVDGFNWLAQLNHWNVGACLADDMGLGKTLQALAAILLHAGDGPTLVVAPLSVMGNWQEECRRFAPTLRPVVFGPGDRQQCLDELKPFDLMIASYGLLQVEADKLAGVEWQTVVLDEAQAIKNMKTKRSQAAMKLNARFRMITTGTPVENHLEELWTLFNFLNPGLLGTNRHFKETFALPIERDQDKAASKSLKKLIRPFILRRTKTNVLKELPEKTEVTLQVEMSPDESVLYEAHRLNALKNIESADDNPGQRHLRILAELTRLRRLCCNPALVMPDTDIPSSKLRVFGDMVTELLANNHKALVFSQFVGHLDILRKYLDDRNISYQYLDGSTRAKDRQKRINAFQNGEGDLFLISLKAGGSGLNLTAADYVIHMDPWWNPAVEDQASDRAHRMGQTRPVTVYRLVVKDSIEEQIIKLHKEKRDLAESLLTGSDMAGKVSAEDLLGLLRQSE